MDSANVVIIIPSSGEVVSAHGVICSIPPVKIISLHWPPVILQSTAEGMPIVTIFFQNSI